MPQQAGVRGAAEAVGGVGRGGRRQLTDHYFSIATFIRNLRKVYRWRGGGGGAAGREATKVTVFCFHPDVHQKLA